MDLHRQILKILHSSTLGQMSPPPHLLGRHPDYALVQRYPLTLRSELRI